MHPIARPLIQLGALFALVALGPAPARAAWPNDPTVNVLLGSSTGFEGSPDIVSDGAGGSLVVYPITDYEIEVKRLDPFGRLLWTCAVLGDPAMVTAMAPAIASDGAGGAFVAYQDQNGSGDPLYVQRISSSGARLWAGNGIAVCTALNNNPLPSIVSDGAGGAIVAWQDRHLGSLHVAAQRITAEGTRLWATDGVTLSEGRAQLWGTLRMRPDGGGGAVIAWSDSLGLTIDIRAQRVSPAGTALWGASGALVRAGAYYYQGRPAIAEDGQGGAYVMYSDSRPGDVWGPFVQHLDETGNALWTAGGLLLNGFAKSFDYDVMPDGAGGAIAAWEAGDVPNNRVRAQRLDPAGNALWVAGGVALRALDTDAAHPQVVHDGSGGAVVAWWDQRSGTDDLYAQRVDASGVARWASDGVPISSAPSDQWNHAMISDGAGGVVATFDDSRAGDYAVYAQHIDAWGVLGGEPAITRIRDAVNDQGGYVYLQWSRSAVDAGSPNGLSAYWLWRQVPASTAQAALARGARLEAGSATPEVSPRGLYTRTTVNGTTFYWEVLGGVAATGVATYELLLPTGCDSVAGSPPQRTVFMVQARGAGGVGFWCSPPDSGYSIDNLAPPQPDPFTGAYIPAAYATALSWGPSVAPDLAGYRLYRGSTPSFTIGPATYAGFATGIGYVDYAGEPRDYKIVAVDLHGNVSAEALAVPSGMADVDGAVAPRTLALSAPSPNPLRGATTLRLALPAAAHVALAVFDQQGRRVRTLADGPRAAGVHPFTWDGRGDGGERVASGLYFVRLDAGGLTLTRRIIALW